MRLPRRAGFNPGRGIGLAPRSKAELAKLSEEELRKLAVEVGVGSAGPKAALIQRIEEQGVAYVADKEQGIHRQAGDADDPGYDPDAQAIGDETLRTLPPGHPGWNDVADPAVIRKPDQADEAPTADHRAPETRDSGESMGPDDLSGRAASTIGEHDRSEETEVHGELKDVHPDSGEQTVSTEESLKEAEADKAAAAAAAAAGDEELRGEALDARGKELGIEGWSGMSADEKRAAVREAEAG